MKGNEMEIERKKQSVFSNTLILTLIALLCCALWGSATPAIKTGYKLLKVEGVASIMLFAGMRFFLAGILTVIIFSIAEKKFLLPKKEIQLLWFLMTDIYSIPYLIK